MTRRQLAGTLALPALFTQAAGTAAAQQAGAQDLDALARRSLERNREALAKFKIDTSIEPAFRFEA
jgi:hypothetical protein